MRRFDDNRDLAVHRGSMSGTGEALSDEEALAILDERIDSPEGEDPDIRIDPEQPRHPADAAQHGPPPSTRQR